LDHIGPLKKDDHGYEYILVLIDVFSRWIELFPTKFTTVLETATCVSEHFGAPAVENVIVEQLLQSNEENAIVERANQEVHLNAIHNVCVVILSAPNGTTYHENGRKDDSGITLSSHILAAPAAACNRSSRVALSDTMESWIEKQYTLLQAAQFNELKSDYHLLNTSLSIPFICMSYSPLLSVVVTRCYPEIEDRSKLWRRQALFVRLTT